MEWLKLIVPLLFVAVWIISQLAKNKDQAAGKMKPPPLPQDDEDAPKPRRSAGEVDRFLEEVRRRRARVEGQAPAAEKPRPKPVPQRPAARPAPEPVRTTLPPLVATPPPLPPPSLPAPRPAPSMPAPRRPQAPQPAVTVSRLQPIEVAVAEVVASENLAPTAPGIVARPARSPAVIQALSLLGSRQSLVAAVVLREVLGPPVSKRKGKVPAYRL